MEIENKFYFFLFLLVLIGIIFFFFNSFIGNYSPTNEERNNLTAHLNNLEIIYYYSLNCSYCEEQNKYINFTMLKNKIDILNSSSTNILGTPAFVLKENIIYGLKTYKELSTIYNFTIN